MREVPSCVTIRNAMRESTYPEIRNRLLAWYDKSQRPLPWRKDHAPYQIWISEIMLQQTRVQTALPYYQRWMARFPDVAAVAEASEDEILKHWEGLGYYSRARNIHATARALMERFDGTLPRSSRTLLSLPGIGSYTAGAIMSLAFNEDTPAVDGNVERVFARVFNIDTPVKEKPGADLIREIAREILPKGDARRFNQALMDLGALVCTPGTPECQRCPIRDSCLSLRRGVVEKRPVRGEKKRSTAIEVAVGVLLRGDRIFIQKRPASGLMPNLWEFPGGKIEAGETPEEALVRELREELGVQVRPLEKIALIRHSYTSFRVALHAYYCTLRDEAAEPKLRSAVESRWASRKELDDYAFPSANRRLIKLLQTEGNRRITGARTGGAPDEREV